jgi:hypothetical protein
MLYITWAVLCIKLTLVVFYSDKKDDVGVSITDFYFKANFSPQVAHNVTDFYFVDALYYLGCVWQYWVIEQWALTRFLLYTSCFAAFCSNVLLVD